MVIKLHETTIPTAKYLSRNKRLEDIIGPLDNKTWSQVQELLDLHIIDRCKRLDLLRYKISQRRTYLARLGKELQEIVGKTERRELSETVEKPVKKATSELQNSIHAVEVQLREASHIKDRYLDIRRSLKDDSDKFESNIGNLEEEIEKQRVDTGKLQTIMDEATRMRTIARKKLLREEKSTQQLAHKRDKEANEGKRLVNERKNELERLERRLFQYGKLSSARPEPEGAEDGGNVGDEDAKPETPPPHPFDTICEQFDVLKEATGASSAEEVLERFNSQKDTKDRLIELRNNREEEKKELEIKVDEFNRKLDAFKYAEVKEAERKTAEMDEIQEKIEENNRKSEEFIARKQQDENRLETIVIELQKLQICINPLSIPENESIKLLEYVENDLKEILNRVGLEDEQKPGEMLIHVDVQDEKWLPTPYSGLIRRTPLPQAGASPVPQPPGIKI